CCATAKRTGSFAGPRPNCPRHPQRRQRRHQQTGDSKEMLDLSLLTAFLQVVMIDLVLAGDNAIVIGLAAAGLPPEQRSKAIFIGIAAATLLRIIFALLASQLLQVVGLVLAGGLLLLWVCWKMWQELHHTAAKDHASEEALEEALEGHPVERVIPGVRQKTLREAVTQIVLADVS
ncbi:MAG: hypothetical protein JNK34_14290, partial [Tabrizicola sp.]|nr:hypothetical protein [Tabrizicola sp.]